MIPVAAVPYKDGFVVVTEDGSVYRYDNAKKAWKNLRAVPGTKCAEAKPSKAAPARKRHAVSTDDDETP